MFRNASRSRLRLALATLIALASGAAFAQTTPPATRSGGSDSVGTVEAAFDEEVSVAWILVPVIVKSKKGYVEGLQRRDFELRVGGRRVDFPDFEQRGEAPWSLVFLQDLSGSMANGGRLEASQEAVRFFLDRAARPGDEFAVATFAGPTTTVDIPFTEDRDAVRDAVSRWEGYGKTAINDAVAWLPAISSDSRNVKRAAILLTDGQDTASQMTAAEARDLVRKAELPVYVLGLESGDPYEIGEDGKKLNLYADVLNLLAQQTGGAYFPIRDPADMKEACATIAENMRYQYVLGFDTASTGKPDWRPISVIVKRKGIQVVARRGYRGTPPAR